MYSELFMVLIASCLVKSSAITVNIYTDENSKEVSTSSCNDDDCDIICKRLGFKDGLCSGGQCKYLLNDQTVSHSCNSAACDQLCRLLGFAGGACNGDNCDCDNWKPLKDLNSKVSVPMSDSCDFQTCDQKCQRLERSGKESLPMVDTCNFQACDQLCRRLGFPGGACVGDRCDCDNFKTLQDIPNHIKPKKLSHGENHEKRHKDIKDIHQTIASGSCDVDSCVIMCTLNNYIGGVCIGDACIGGVCIGGTCQCF